MKLNQNSSYFSSIKSITVLLPALNEEKNLRPTVEQVIQALKVTMDDFEIIIINDGSSDNTRKIADEIANLYSNIIVVHNATPRGLGHVYAQGINLANKKYFVYIPSDNTWPYRSFVELFGNLGRAEIITSYSSNPEIRPFSRRIVSKKFTQTMNLLFGLNLNYYNGLTIYPIEYLRRNPITTFGFGFQSEVLIKAIKLGYSFIELSLPIVERTVGFSKAVTLKNISSVISTILRLFWNIQITNNWVFSQKLSTNQRDKKLISHDNQRLDESGIDSINTQLQFEKSEVLNIVITGGSSGIGAAIFKELVNAGHRVFVCSTNENKLKEVTKNSISGEYFVCDVSNENDVKNFYNFLSNKIDKLDVLINCAGKFGSIGKLEFTKPQEWINTLEVNLFGVYLMTHYFLPLLKKGKNSQVINFSGGGAFNPNPNFSAYSCSKAAVVRLTETLAIELLDYGIRVNAIAPGRIATPAHESILKAGVELVGELQIKKTQLLLSEGGASITKVIDCVKMFLTDKMLGLTGKTISANFDPWESDIFQENILEIVNSDLYSMCRMNIVNLPEGKLKKKMNDVISRQPVLL
jgi:NAD(P)-dependent dehydrogenase (short-subunit alcohol dehydrogenase family)